MGGLEMWFDSTSDPGNTVGLAQIQSLVLCSSDFGYTFRDVESSTVFLTNCDL